jgi:hypothetical protein
VSSNKGITPILFTNEGSTMKCKFKVLPVERPLLSVAALIEAGIAVEFARYHAVIRFRNGTVSTAVKKNHIYVWQVWVECEDEQEEEREEASENHQAAQEEDKEENERMETEDEDDRIGNGSGNEESIDEGVDITESGPSRDSQRQPRQEEETDNEEEEKGFGGEKVESESEVEHGQRRLKMIPTPYTPSDRERKEHAVSHIPYRSWCEHCIRGKAQKESH